MDKSVVFHQIKDYIQEVEQWHLLSFAWERREKMENSIIVSENRIHKI